MIPARESSDIACRLCGETARLKAFTARERMFGMPGTFDYVKRGSRGRGGVFVSDFWDNSTCFQFQVGRAYRSGRDMHSAWIMNASGLARKLARSLRFSADCAHAAWLNFTNQGDQGCFILRRRHE
jgi:hypothetical protein